MSNTTNTTSGGTSLTGLLTILFIALKLTGVITWSWWWVTCPAWAGLAIALFGLALYFLAAVGIPVIYHGTIALGLIIQCGFNWVIGKLRK